MRIEKTKDDKIVFEVGRSEKNCGNFFNRFFEEVYWDDLYFFRSKYLLDFNKGKAYQIFDYEVCRGKEQEYYNNLILSKFNDDGKLVLYPLDDDFTRELFDENNENN